MRRRTTVERLPIHRWLSLSQTVEPILENDFPNVRNYSLMCGIAVKTARIYGCITLNISAPCGVTVAL